MSQLSVLNPFSALRRMRSSDPLEQDVALSNSFVAEALAANKREGLRLAITARWFALAISAVLILMLNPSWYEALFYEAAIVAFALIGWAQLNAGTVGRSSREMFLIFCDVALMTAIFVIPNPLREQTFPSAFQYQFLEFGYFYIFVAAGTLGYSWRTLSMFGFWTVLLWGSALALTMIFGVYTPELTERMTTTFSDYPLMADILNPNDFDVTARIQEVVVFLIVVGILMVNGRRNTQLFYRQVAAFQERANLARHFSPTIVEQLAHQNEPLAEVRSQEVAIMFVDIVGFTPIAEELEPTEMVALLRQFHGRLERQVFDHHGTLDKFLGDGLMATFGNPTTSTDDGANALACGIAIINNFDIWNQQRAAEGLPPIIVSIGIHYGEVVLGDIGSERRLEYAVLGDSVNVASRLEALTRKLGTQLAVSQDLVEQIPDPNDLRPLSNLGPQQLKGRNKPVTVWGLK